MGKDHIIFQRSKASRFFSCIARAVLPTRMKRFYKHRMRDSCGYIDICTVLSQLLPPELKKKNHIKY